MRCLNLTDIIEFNKVMTNKFSKEQLEEFIRLIAADNETSYNNAVESFYVDTMGFDYEDAEDLINSIKSGNPNAIKRFIADIDNSGPHSTIGQARFALMLEAAKLGGTHMVEMHAFPAHITFRLIGVELSARVYKCPEGRGPTVTRDEALMKVDYPMVDPEIYDIH